MVAERGSTSLSGEPHLRWLAREVRSWLLQGRVMVVSVKFHQLQLGCGHHCPEPMNRTLRNAPEPIQGTRWHPGGHTRLPLWP